MTSAKPMMALSGVRISWLTLARKSDFAEEAFSASRLALVRSSSARFHCVMSRNTMQNFSSARRPIVINSGISPPWRTRPITSRPSLSTLATPARTRPSRYSCAARWLSGANRSTKLRFAISCDSYPNSASALRLLATILPSRSTTSTPSVAVSRTDSSSRVACWAARKASSALLTRSSVPASAASAPRTRRSAARTASSAALMPWDREEAALDRERSAAPGDDGQASSRAAGLAQNREAGLGQQALQSSGRDDGFGALVTGPVEHRTIDDENLVAAEDQHADGKPIEHRALAVALGRSRRGILAGCVGAGDRPRPDATRCARPFPIVFQGRWRFTHCTFVCRRSVLGRLRWWNVGTARRLGRALLDTGAERLRNLLERIMFDRRERRPLVGGDRHGRAKRHHVLGRRNDGQQRTLGCRRARSSLRVQLVGWRFRVRARFCA